MRVLHLVKTSVGATWAVRQMRELVALGVEVHVAAPAGGPTLARYEAAGVTVHKGQFDVPGRAPWTLPGVLGDLRRLVGQVQPDLVHSHFVGTTLTLRLALGKSHPLPRVFQVPGPLHLEHPAFRAAELATAGPSDAWIGSCRWTCERYRRSGVPPERVFLSYYGVDVEHFERGAPTGALRRAARVGPDVKLVGLVAYLYAPKRYLGQTRGLKGHEDLIDAMARLAPRHRDARCVMVGGAWNGATAYEERVHAYARARLPGRVIFLGTRADVGELYPDFDVVAHPSHSENVGGAVESLLAGVPTVASDVGGLPDLVRPGETGWLVPPRSPEALARALDEALDDPGRARAMALRGRELARALLDVRTNAREVLAAYEAIPGPGGAAVRVAVVTEQRFQGLPDGRTFTHSTFPYAFWTRYLDVFDEVRVVARVEPVARVPASFLEVGGPGVTVAPVPYYVGPAQLLRVRRAVARALAAAVGPEDAVILRLPSLLANTLEPALAARGQPFGVELVGDPSETFAPGGVRHPLRPFFRFWLTRALRRQCRTACAVGYVNASVLERAYPASASALRTTYSSIDLLDDALVASPRPPRAGGGPTRLLLVGSLEQLYKGPDVLLDALARVVARGLDVELRIVGDGKHRAELEASARALGLGRRVTFVGQIPGGAPIRAELDAADLFVLPSRTEGLPRALIEAMARGLPAVGSTAGGIPELLPAEALVPPGDAGALAARLVEVLASPSLRASLGARNLERAQEYRAEALRARRRALYARVREETEASRKTGR